MPSATRSMFSASIALAGAAAIAVSPLALPPDVQLPTLQSHAIELTAVPALGAIPYQIVVNQLANVLALAPIVIGSVEQCTACLGPAGGTSPFAGWGALGIGAGLLGSPIVFFEALSATSDFAQALGAAGLAIQTPITNTLALLGVDRTPFGGFELQAVLDRAFIALKHSIDYAINIAAQALVSGPLTVIGGVVIGLQTFVGTLAATGDVIAAFNAGRIPVNTAVTESLAALTAETQEARATIYADLTAGPGRAASPIPTVPAPTAAAVNQQSQIRAAAATETAPATETATIETPTAAPDAVSARTGAAKRVSAVESPRAAAAESTGTEVSQAARDAVGQARATGEQVGKAVKAAVGAPKRVRTAR